MTKSEQTALLLKRSWSDMKPQGEWDKTASWPRSHRAVPGGI